MKQGPTLALAALAALGFPGIAMAQSADFMSLSMDDLRSELESRYNAALAKTQSADTLQSTDSSFLWATEAKIQCGIAIGYTKSNTRDADSIGKCDRFYQRMMLTPPIARTTPPPLPPKPDPCGDKTPAIFYFDWDSSIPQQNAGDSVAFINENREICNWNAFLLTGYTDLSGPDSYNYPLSVDRANAIAELLREAGVPGNIIRTEGKGETNPRVQTLDGERNPANRRVEITINR